MMTRVHPLKSSHSHDNRIDILTSSRLVKRIEECRNPNPSFNQDAFEILIDWIKVKTSWGNAAGPCTRVWQQSSRHISDSVPCLFHAVCVNKFLFMELKFFKIHFFPASINSHQSWTFRSSHFRKLSHDHTSVHQHPVDHSSYPPEKSYVRVADSV